MKKIITILLLTLFAGVSFAVNNPMSYQNALYDSDAMKYNGEYYFSGNFTCGDMLASRDLRNWGWRTHVFSWNNSWYTPTDPTNPDHDIHASHMRYYNGIFYYYTQLGEDIILATNNVGPLATYFEPYDYNFASKIDADTFRDDDGTFIFYSTRFESGNTIHYRPMTDLLTFSSPSYPMLISSSSGDGDNITEGSKVFKYRDKYYMLYATYHTGNYDYRMRGVEADSPTSFNNAGKYTDPILSRKMLDGNREFVQMGQPWVVEGPNGFERWVGYFTRLRTVTPDKVIEAGQYIDRLYFLGDDLKADGPTHRDSTGYHPPPALPKYLGLFNGPDGGLPAELTYGAGTWNVVNKELRQTESSGFKYVVIDPNRADNFLVEANVKFLNGSSKRAGLVLFQDADDWIRVGLDNENGSWYFHKMSDGVETVTGFPLAANFNYQAYHKIQLQKNGNTIYIKIDDIPSIGLSETIVNFDGSAQMEIYTDNAQTAFDGVVYTIGWDEWNDRVQYWGGTKSGVPLVGTWNYGSWGIDQLETNGMKYIFKGDLMDEYEIDARCTVRYSNANANRRIGIMPVAIDANNYMFAEIDPDTTELVVWGVSNGVTYTYSNTAITYNPTPNSWNIRAAKLSDKVIIFVNGKEIFTANVSYGASQVGLVTENQDAIFSSVIVYETKDKSLPMAWQETDLGDVKYTGRADFTEDFITINASGWRFWHTGDEGHFVYQQMSNNKEFITKVETLDPAGYWSKAAIMIRDNLNSNSPMAYVCLTKMDANNTNSVQFIWRGGTGWGTGVSHIDKYKVFPSYIKLIRLGNIFSAYWSRDGNDWELVGDETINNIDQNCYIGLAVSAENSDRYTGAVFSDVTINNIPEPTVTILFFVLILKLYFIKK